jgi:hypothetical protein
MRRRLEALERQVTAVAYTTPATPAAVEPAAPVPVNETRPPDDRIATDNKVWPAP